jgi:hypothetical protein
LNRARRARITRAHGSRAIGTNEQISGADAQDSKTTHRAISPKPQEKKVKTAIVAMLLATTLSSLPVHAEPDPAACAAEARSVYGQTLSLNQLMKYMEEHPSCGKRQRHTNDKRMDCINLTLRIPGAIQRSSRWWPLSVADDVETAENACAQ